MNDALAVAHDVAIGKGKPAADLVHVDMRLDPVANARGAGEVGRHTGRRQHGWRPGARRRAVTERDIAQRHQQPAMRAATSVGMTWQDPQADDERRVGVPAHEEWTEMIEERAASEQRFEAWRGTGIRHCAISPRGVEGRTTPPRMTEPRRGTSIQKMNVSYGSACSQLIRRPAFPFLRGRQMK